MKLIFSRKDTFERIYAFIIIHMIFSAIFSEKYDPNKGSPYISTVVLLEAYILGDTQTAVF